MQEVNFLKQFNQDMKGDQVEMNILADDQGKSKLVTLVKG